MKTLLTNVEAQSRIHSAPSDHWHGGQRGQARGCPACSSGFWAASKSHAAGPLPAGHTWSEAGMGQGPVGRGAGLVRPEGQGGCGAGLLRTWSHRATEVK